MFNLLFGFWGQQSKEETQDLSHIRQFFLWIQGDKESFSCQTGDLQWVLGKGMRSNACKIPTPAAVSHLVQLQSGTESSPSPGALFQSPSYVLRRAHYIQFMYHKQVHGSRGLCWDLHLWRSHSTWAPTALLDPCRLLWAKASWIPWLQSGALVLYFIFNTKGCVCIFKMEYMHISIHLRACSHCKILCNNFV